MIVSDEELMLECRKGDMSAFELACQKVSGCARKLYPLHYQRLSSC